MLLANSRSWNLVSKDKFPIRDRKFSRQKIGLLVIVSR